MSKKWLVVGLVVSALLLFSVSLFAQEAADIQKSGGPSKIGEEHAKISKLIVYPKVLKDWENFTAKELESMQKDVDKGQQPWRVFPEDYTNIFMSFYYKAINSPMITSNNTEEIRGSKAIVKKTYDHKQHTFFLHKAFPSNQHSIWVIDKMIISSAK
ncbi:MAG: hypothetical protein V1650_04275 [Candidatus Omnitrophota bacterium]